MNCRQARRLLHLDRPGERTEREERNLQEHLATCASCAAEADGAHRLREHEGHLRSATVPVPDLSDVRARVLTAIAAPAQRTSGHRAPRLAYALTLAVTIAWFGVEQWRVQTAHEMLSERAARSNPETVGPQLVYRVDAAHARALVAQHSTITAGLLADGTLEVPQATVQQWLENSPALLARTITRQPDQQAQIADALRFLQSAVGMAVRYRSPGA
jgi:predicted anti-sigma-YlaC factor YlaD